MKSFVIRASHWQITSQTNVIHGRHSFKSLANHFTSDQASLFTVVTRKNDWQMTSRVTKNIVILGNECIILFLHHCSCFWIYACAPISF